MAKAKLKTVSKASNAGKAVVKTAKPKPAPPPKTGSKTAAGSKEKTAKPQAKPRTGVTVSKAKPVAKPQGKAKPVAKTAAKVSKAKPMAKAPAKAKPVAKPVAKAASKFKAVTKPVANAKGKTKPMGKVVTKVATKVTSKVPKATAKPVSKPAVKKLVNQAVTVKPAVKPVAKSIAKPVAMRPVKANIPVIQPTGKQPVVPTKVAVKPVVAANKTIVVEKPSKSDVVAPGKPAKLSKADAIAAAKKNMAAVLAAVPVPVKTGKPGRPPKNAVAAPEAETAEAAAPVAIAINPLTGKPKTRKQLLLEKKQQALLEALAPFKTVDAETRRLRLKTLITLGKDRGYLTYSEINDHLPDDLVDAEAIESIVAMINDMGIQVFDEAPAAEELIISETASAVADDDVAEEAEQAISQLDSEFGRTTDPVRMYMREMGTVELLTREGEIEIAMRIEDGLKHRVQAI